MVELFQRFWDVLWHTDVDRSFLAVPFKSQSAIVFSCFVNGNIIIFFNVVTKCSKSCSESNLIPKSSTHKANFVGKVICANKPLVRGIGKYPFPARHLTSNF